MVLLLRYVDQETICVKMKRELLYHVSDAVVLLCCVLCWFVYCDTWLLVQVATIPSP